MVNGRVMATAAVASALALSLAGCAGSLKITGRKMCEATGGTYNAQTRACTYTAQTRTAQQSCQLHGGYYDPAADVCEIGLD